MVRITTKRGRSGAPRWNLYGEFGLVEDNNDYPLNYGAVTADGDPRLLFETVGDDACQQSTLNTFQPLADDELSPFALGDRQQYGFNVSGGSETITYFVAAEFEKEDGVYELPDFYTRSLQETSPDLPTDNQVTPNDLRRVSVRANVGAEIAPGLRVQTNAGFLSSDARLPQNDNNSLGMIPSGLLGSATRDDNDGYGFRTPAEVFAIEVLQEIERFTGSSQLEWRPPQVDFLSARATIGVDFTTRRGALSGGGNGIRPRRDASRRSRHDAESPARADSVNAKVVVERENRVPAPPLRNGHEARVREVHRDIMVLLHQHMDTADHVVDIFDDQFRLHNHAKQ